MALPTVSTHLAKAFTAGAAAALLMLGASPSSAAPAAAPCNQGSYCWWSGANFSGSGISYTGDLVSGGCYLTSHVGSVRSYAHYHRQEGYFYANSNCTGRSHAVRAHSENPDIGFNAYSFKAACVSCLAKD
ncbi:peptidase inhibitor family I36 protein [Streptomyces sp. NRRL B-24085]|uniref:peptidase inhibitor family I36 protein n=1 Tax=Streptomyces sp. NRRL B-24085 TaxID=1709476 RepID=UPI0006B3BADF|nr:peptidase inhibitor family I36 protein [Streptomyces sp. NRRL B-24085]